MREVSQRVLQRHDNAGSDLAHGRQFLIGRHLSIERERVTKAKRSLADSVPEIDIAPFK
jgi:hypothetical protein